MQIFYFFIIFLLNLSVMERCISDVISRKSFMHSVHTSIFALLRTGQELLLRAIILVTFPTWNAFIPTMYLPFSPTLFTLPYERVLLSSQSIQYPPYSIIFCPLILIYFCFLTFIKCWHIKYIIFSIQENVYFIKSRIVDIFILST